MTGGKVQCESRSSNQSNTWCGGWLVALQIIRYESTETQLAIAPKEAQDAAKLVTVCQTSDSLTPNLCNGPRNCGTRAVV